MNYRLASILASKTATTAGTETVDINLKDPISRIIVKYNHKNGSHDPDAHPAKIVSRIEVVDGSEVLASLSGIQAEALHFFDTKERRGEELEYRNGVWGAVLLPLNFGRFLYDPQLALDPTRFRNPQIKVSHDIANGGSSVSESSLEIFAHVFDEKVISPMGFLLNKEWYSYTLSSNQYKSIDLPTDHILKRVLIKALTADYEITDQFAEVRVSEDNDKRIPYDLDMADLRAIVAQRYGEFVEDFVGCFSGVDRHDWFITPGNKATVQCSPIGWAEVRTEEERYGGYCELLTNAVCVHREHVSGFEPHGAVPLDFGDQRDIDDWYDVTKLGSLILRLKDGSSPSGTGKVITQQLRRY